MHMPPVEAIEVKPGEPMVLKPGGLHVMLMGLKAPREEGETFTLMLTLMLTFEQAGSVEVQVTVPEPGATGMANSRAARVWPRVGLGALGWRPIRHDRFRRPGAPSHPAARAARR